MSVSRYDLYEWCVQAPETAARFLHALHGARPRRLEEHFCGPAAIARAWIALAPSHRSCAVDRDPEPLAHAGARAEQQLGRRTARLALVRADVLRLSAARDPALREKPDVIAAFNFAVCELHSRRALRAYLRLARARLKPGGVLALDLYGGASAWETGVSRVRVRTPIGAVGYAWEQVEADPVSALVRNQIHFELSAAGAKAAGLPRRLRGAFTYFWRLWGVRELGEAMLEAGFRRVEIHDSYGGAVDDRGRLYPTPIGVIWADGRCEMAQPTDDPRQWVVYLVGRR